MTLTRRQLLLGGAGLLVVGGGGFGLVEAGVLPGRARLNSVLGWDGVDTAVPDIDTGPVASGSFVSTVRGRRVGWSILRPPGASGRLPVAIVLHGKGSDHTGAVALGYPQFLAVAVAAGTPPFALATVDGGDTYWHRRADGDDPPAMITQEFLPLLAGQGLATGRPALHGWSMGGYGALLLAERWGARQPAAVSVMSPAIFASYAASSNVAYDNEADFDANTLFPGIDALAGVPLWVDCGSDDPFAAETTRFRAAVRPTPAGGISPGAHDDRFWHRMLPAQLDFIGRALTR